MTEKPLTPQSQIKVEKVRGKSNLTRSHSQAPLKILSPLTSGKACKVYLSNYGGGFVEGDTININIECGQDSYLYLGTQAHTKVFKCPKGKFSSQNISGKISNGGCVISIPDPIVLQAQANFIQSQEWKLENKAMLVLVDWYTAGRLENEEKFEYTKYESKLQVTLGGNPILVENFKSDLKQLLPESSGLIQQHPVVFNLFVIGYSGEKKFDLTTNYIQNYLKQDLEKKLEPDFKTYAINESSFNNMLTYSKAKSNLLTVRGVGQNNEFFNPFLCKLGELMKSSDLLGENPVKRKF